MGPRAASRSKGTNRSKLFESASSSSNGLFNKNPRNSFSSSPVSLTPSVAPLTKTVLNDLTKPSLNIERIVSELNLKYDADTGSLSGDSVSASSVADLNLQLLTNLRSLVKNLKKTLKQELQHDRLNELKIKQKLYEEFDNNAFDADDFAYMKTAEDFEVSDKVQQLIDSLEEDQELMKEESTQIKSETQEDHILMGHKSKHLTEPGATTSGTDTILDRGNQTEEKEISTVAAAAEDEVSDDDRPLKKLKLDEAGAIEPNSAHFFDMDKLLEAVDKLRLFKEDKEQASKGDIEYLKRWYAVSSFPSDYLREYLTGDIPDIDFNAQKEIKNKINFNNFLAYLDHYYRPFDDEDLIFLKKNSVFSPHLTSFYTSTFNESNSKPNGTSVASGAKPGTPLNGATPGAVSKTGAAAAGEENKILSYNPKIHPFIIPKLGKLYTKVWAEKDGWNGSNGSGNTLSPATSSATLTSTGKTSSPSPQESINVKMKDQLVAKSTPESLNDSVLESDSVSCGPLMSRLLSAFIKNDPNDQPAAAQNLDFLEDSDDEDRQQAEQVKEEDMDDDKKLGFMNNDSSAHKNDNGSLANGGTKSGGDVEKSTMYFEGFGAAKDAASSYDYSTLEERLKRELKYVGVYLNYQNEVDETKEKLDSTVTHEDILHENFEDAWITNKQDDEISRELRHLQKELKVVNLRNNLRKRAIFKKVYEEISFREFYNILENLNKQIDQYYIKKQKILGRINKKHKGRASTAANAAANSSATPTPSGAEDHQSHGSGASLSHQQVIDKTLNSLIEKRHKWIEKIGPLFDYKENIQLRKYPEDPVFDSKIAMINKDNFEDFYEIYTEFYNNNEEEEDFENSVANAGATGDPAGGILLSEGVKITKADLMLEQNEESDLERKFHAIKVEENGASTA